MYESCHPTVSLKNVWFDYCDEQCSQMIVGIALYIIGAISFGLRFPKLAPKYFGFHEVWHSNVSVAAVLHFIVIYSII